MVLTGGSGLVGGGGGSASSLIRQLDFQDSVLDKDLNTPPGSPSIGDKYIVAAGGTGAWSGLDDKLVTWGGSVWVVSNTNEGFMCTVEDENVIYHFTGTVWEKLGNIIDHFLLLNLQGGLAAERYHLEAQQHANVTSIATAIYTQLANIDTTTISIAQWGFLGAMDQGVATTDKHTMLGVDLTTGGIEDNNVITPIELGDPSNTSFNTTNKTIVGALNETFGAIPIAIEDRFTPTLGQTVFALSATPSGAEAFALYLNGQLREVTTDYTQSGTTLTWLDPGGLTLVTTDLLVARYNDVAGSVTSAWTDDGTDLTPTNVGRNVDIGTGLLKDNDATAGIALAEPGDTVLDAAFTAASIIGALNENKVSETFLSKSFGDSPFASSAGDNAVAWNTAGGSVSHILPLASSNPGVRIRISKASSDTNQVVINTTGGDTVGFQGQWTLSHQGDSITGISDGISDWCLFTERHAAGFEYFLPDHDGNLGNHRVQNISSTGNANFEFRMPPDFLSIVSLIIEFAPTAAGSAGAGKDIDFTSDYHANGEVFNFHTESDTSSTYDTGTQNIRTFIDISGVFSSVSANDLCGINVDHNGIGGNMAYYGIALSYLRKG